MLSASTTSLNVAAQSKACRANAFAPLSARPTFSPMQAQPMQHSLWLAPSQAVQTQRCAKRRLHMPSMHVCWQAID